jgi:hypothetical protein
MIIMETFKRKNVSFFTLDISLLENIPKNNHLETLGIKNVSIVLRPKF